MGRGSRQSFRQRVWWLMKLHDSYVAYNKNILQDMCLLLGMQIIFNISLHILPKIPCVKIACFYEFLAENQFFAISLCRPIFPICSKDRWYLFNSYTMVANIRVWDWDVYYRKSRGSCNPPPPFGGRLTENGSGGRGLILQAFIKRLF